MRETVGSWIANKWTGGRSTRTFILNKQDRERERHEEEQRGRDACQRLVDFEIERKKNPIKCEICSARKGEDVFFEGLSWFHCPKCGQHGYPSMKGGIECTSCANMRIHGHN